MKNFHYYIPTEIFFGKGQIKNLGTNMKKLGDKVLLVYGGGSIKKNGLYDMVMSQLQSEDITVCELSGVEPNPRIESVRKGVEICRKEGVKAVLAVGGGSTIDCAKMIACGTLYDGDAWDLVLNPGKIEKTLPVAAVLTLSATGSEMDGFAVISDLQKNEKWGTGSDVTKPVFSILDPEYTYTVSKYQTMAGTADIMSHTFENYFNQTKGAFLQARMAEGVLKTCIKYLPIALENPEDYEARANLMWSASLAINGLLSYGAADGWSVHAMEHELSAYYDITHGVGLAILTPFWMDYVLNEDTLWKFVEYGRNVWDITEGTDMEIAKASIEKTREFFKSVGLPSTLTEIKIDAEHFDIMAKKAAAGSPAAGFVPLKEADVKKIFENAL